MQLKEDDLFSTIWGISESCKATIHSIIYKTAAVSFLRIDLSSFRNGVAVRSCICSIYLVLNFKSCTNHISDEVKLHAMVFHV